MEKSLKPNNNRYDPAADIVIGMSDGIVIPFALAAGLTGALVSTNIILIAGLVEIAAGSIALGIGGYLTARSEYPKFSTSVDLRTQQDPVNRRNNLDAFFSSLGLTGEAPP
ncbi:MAG: hypothetical protein EOO36_09970 [Cytophagaceae bacterium]|nr:MAG: hypothetical protein EOO36_09970 [Cytophagaceae bacterium]